MWNTDNTSKVNETRTVVIGADGRTDITATLYAFGNDEVRLLVANELLKAARALWVMSPQFVNTFDADAVNTLRSEARKLATKAVWMAPDDAMAEIDGRPEPMAIEGKDTEGWLLLRDSETALDELHAIGVVVFHPSV